MARSINGRRQSTVSVQCVYGSMQSSYRSCCCCCYISYDGHVMVRPIVARLAENDAVSQLPIQEFIDLVIVSAIFMLRVAKLPVCCSASVK